MDYPNAFEKLRKQYPGVVKAYEMLGDAARLAGPLYEREQRLVKLALSLGAGLEGAAHSHARSASGWGRWNAKSWRFRSG